jgi:putative FmdB family regulatory protein
MPVYEYLCDRCGPFTRMRPMAESDLPSECPDCAGTAPRVILTAPYCSTLSAESRNAYATNERSANSPRLSSAGDSHGGGCTCCAARPLGRRKKGKEKAAAKSFPNSRPWMISH